MITNKKTRLFDSLKIEALSLKNWALFEELFGLRGACGGCWCMAFRLKKGDFEDGKKLEGNKKSMLKIVEDGKAAGLIGIIDSKAVAWCAFAPREDFIRLNYSRVHKAIDDKAVWSIPCFFIDREFRRQGLSLIFLQKIIGYAKENNVKILEAYPLIPSGKLPDAFVWVGLYKTFEQAGFNIVDQKSRNRPMVRIEL